MAQEEAYCIADEESCVFSSLEIEEDETVIFGINKSSNTNDILTVYFKNSSIFAVPREIFSIFPKVMILSMEGQNVQQIRTDTFVNAGNLGSLWLDENNIKELFSNAFNGLLKLKNLNICDNKLEIVNFDCFKGLSGLNDLRMDNNNLDFFPKNVFKDLVNLRSISLANNKLEYLPKRLFENNKILGTVVFKGNPIKAVNPKMFSHLNKLKYLDLSGPNCVDELFSTLRNLDFEKIESAIKRCSISEFFLNKYDDIKLEIQSRIQKFVYKLEKIMELDGTFV